MRFLMVPALVFAFAAPPSFAVPLGSVPAGARVRLVLEGRSGTHHGSLVDSRADSLRVRLRSGSTLVVPVAAVQSFAWMDGLVPSGRKANLLGIGLGAAGGAVLGVVAGQVNSEGGGGGGGGGEGGRDGRARVVSAAAAPAATPPATSAEYRAVLGAIVGGLAGGLFGSLTGLGMKQEHWTTVPVPAPATSWAPAPAAPPLFAVRLPLPHRTPR